MTTNGPDAAPRFSASALISYTRCGRAYMYRHVLGIEEEETSWSSIIGIATHDAVANWHSLGRRDPLEALLRDFTAMLWKQVQRAEKDGKLVKGFEGEVSVVDAVTDATAMLNGYITDPRNQVPLVVNEARFEVTVGKRGYLFTGYVDQIRELPDGRLHLVDLKTGKSRLGDFVLSLDYQLSIYALAMAYGTFFRRDGSPLRFERRPDLISLAFLRDYEVYQKNQYAEFMKSGRKVKSEKTKKLVNEMVPNPEFATGYKVGDPKGPVFYDTTRTEHQLTEAALDISRVCAAIRLKQFFRSPSTQTCGQCRFRQLCESERTPLELAQEG